MKKLLPVLLCAAMLLCLLPLEARAAAAVRNPRYARRAGDLPRARNSRRALFSRCIRRTFRAGTNFS